MSIFIAIQLNNQMTNLTQFNSYQASLSSLITKNNLESGWVKEKPEELSRYLQEILLNLNQANIIKEAKVFNKEGEIIASTDQSLIGTITSYRDLLQIDGLLNSKKEFLPLIDKPKRKIDIYFRLLDKDYFCKTSFSLGNIKEALLGVYRPAIIACIIIILANIFVGFLLSKMVIGPIKVLNEVTKLIAEGNLNVRTNILTGDELQELGETFNYMALELIKMKERAENANPLTKLPGNIVIREEVEKRIREGKKFVVIYCDLDNFKAFNDKYGIAKGDEAIKLTADIFKEAVKTQGNPDDFVGHEGGDDFILLTTPDKAQNIADYIIKEFDQRIRNLYSQEDLTRGYILAQARDGSIKQFPLMTISLSGVTNTHRTISSYGEVTNIAAEVKKKAKSIPQSVFVIDKRKA
jgi:diguanylate cyclase (GGDEF)-like protein